jgi:FKBP-type peptidyl-prolyl cis-trans isomerase
MSQVKEKDTVKVHYTGKLSASGQVFDSSLEREPIEFTLIENLKNEEGEEEKGKK